MIMCPDQVQLESLLNNRLVDTERDLLEQHVEDCDVCQHVLELLTATTLIQPTEGYAAEMATRGFGFGPYTLVEKIGEGGMGTVYLAAQETPVRRQVAIKIIKTGADPADPYSVQRRAASVALMDHPNIAKVFDAGSTEAGLSYFVMELVNGMPITDFCDRAQLTTNERLELFLQVCQAIQHAHQKGIIHRDVKPSNVLVTAIDGKPLPRVIDFGLAKAIDHGQTEKTVFTQHGVIVGTLEYMSPEQAGLSSLDIDSRSDIYSLGVMLYELLTGSTPLDRVPPA